jgi:hypothetical protein
MKWYKKIHAFYLLMLCRLGLTTSKTYVHIYYARANHNILMSNIIPISDHRCVRSRNYLPFRVSIVLVLDHWLPFCVHFILVIVFSAVLNVRLLSATSSSTSKTYVHIYYARANHNILQYVVSSLIKQYAAIQLLMFAYDR